MEIIDDKKLCKQCNKNPGAQGRPKCWSCYDKQRSPEIIERRRLSSIKRTAKWQKANRSHVNNWRKTHRIVIKQEVVNKYGGCCKCCGETNVGFLTMDHINNDGHIRRKTNISEANIFEHLNNKPIDLQIYQVLCANCNFGRQWNNGICPHLESQFDVLPPEQPQFEQPNVTITTSLCI